MMESPFGQLQISVLVVGGGVWAEPEGHPLPSGRGEQSLRRGGGLSGPQKSNNQHKGPKFGPGFLAKGQI